MSFDSILSGPAEEPPARKASPPPPPIQKPPEPPAIAPAPVQQKSKQSTEKRRHTAQSDQYKDISPRPPTNGTSDKSSSTAGKSRKAFLDRENEKLQKNLERIDAMDHSDVEAPGFEQEWQRYVMKGKKRAREAEASEAQKRKVCLVFFFF